METDKVQYEIDLSGIETDTMWSTITSDPKSMNSITGAQGSAIPGGSYTINTSQFNGTSGANFYYTNNTGITGVDYSQPALQVTGDADFKGDITWKGRSLGSLLETIEKRLAILQPDPEKLEHFEALQKAYEHYKTLEALCQIPKKDKE